MMASSGLRTDGKFFRAGPVRAALRAVTYGPFPGGWPRDFAPDFRRIRAAGFDTLRLYEMPDAGLLAAAAAHGLGVFGGLRWGQNHDFFQRPALFSAARVEFKRALGEVGAHPALAGVFVGNEIPADLVRWMGPARVREAIEDLIGLGREVAPHLLFAYANYPSTEYLEPENADFTAFNIYLEDADAFRGYLKRLHHIAGDRPLVISEFGLDSRRNGVERQAALLREAMEISWQEECAGFTAYAWSDRWWNNGAEVEDWDFGLIDRDGNDKPALAALAGVNPPSLPDGPLFSVIVCTRNGSHRIGSCLDAIGKMAGRFETIVVDDGSTDGTADMVERDHPSVRLLRLDPCGLGAARNAGAAAATGGILAFTDDDCEPDAEWLPRLARVLADGRFAAAGGPNIPPPPQDWHQAVVCELPGAPSHVMLDDERAEHLPGCNLAVTREAFHAIGGFDPRFHTAGDDVDFCWRLRDAGCRMGFAPGAFVWHHRRPHIRGYLRQQFGYGVAERLLMEKHPQRFTRRGSAKWSGRVYDGGPVRVFEGDVIYHGMMGAGGYQSIVRQADHQRTMRGRLRGWKAGLARFIAGFIAPRLRAWARNQTIFPDAVAVFTKRRPQRNINQWEMYGNGRDELLARLVADGWMPCGVTDDWDVEHGGTRLLLATERGDDGAMNTLVRICGEPDDLPPWLRPQSSEGAPEDETGGEQHQHREDPAQ